MNLGRLGRTLVRHRRRLGAGLSGTLVLLAGAGALAWWFRQSANRPLARAWADGTDPLD